MGFGKFCLNVPANKNNYKNVKNVGTFKTSVVYELPDK